MCSGSPVTATIEIAERNPTAFKSDKLPASTGMVELAESKGITDQAGSKPNSRRTSHAGGGTANPAVGLPGQPDNDVMGIAPAVGGQSTGFPLTPRIYPPSFSQILCPVLCTVRAVSLAVVEKTLQCLIFCKVDSIILLTSVGPNLSYPERVGSQLQSVSARQVTAEEMLDVTSVLAVRGCIRFGCALQERLLKSTTS